MFVHLAYSRRGPLHVQMACSWPGVPICPSFGLADSPDGVALLSYSCHSVVTPCPAGLQSALPVRLANRLALLFQLAFNWPCLSRWPTFGLQLAYSWPSWHIVGPVCSAGLQLAQFTQLFSDGL
jgi:hypothetical protein